MKIEVIYTKKAKYSKDILSAMARYVKTYAKEITEFNESENVDLLVIGFDDTFSNEHELYSFIERLDRSKIKNVCLVNTFLVKNKKMDKIVELCHKKRLPLMRQQFSIKLNVKCLKIIPQAAIDNARIYIDDMVNVINKYY